MIDITNEIEENYPSIDLEEIKEIQPELPDDMLNSIHLYNKALNDLKSGSEDIAIIGLKKAIAVNPGFHEAMNLLGICYLKLNQREQAKGVFNKVINSEKNGIRALEYINDLEGNTGNATPSKKIKKSNGISAKLSLWVGRSLNVETGSDILKYIAGLAVGIILVAVLWTALPGDKPLIKFNKNDKATLEQLQQKTDELEKATNDINAYKQKISELEGNLTLIEEEKILLKQAEEHRNFITNAVKEKNYLEAADRLFQLKSTNELDRLGMTTEFNELYNTLPQLLYNKTRESFLATSNQIKNARRVSDEIYKALEQQAKAFEIVTKFNGEYDFITSLYYYLGKCYHAMASVNEEAVNMQKAKDAYNKVIELPDVGNSKWAGIRLDEIASGKYWWQK